MRYAIAAAVILVATASVAAQTRQLPNATITAVPGIKVGHFRLTERPTGCTVILVDGDAVGGVAQRGGAPATHEPDSLHPLNTVDRVHGVVLSGGSAFGLEAAIGVVRRGERGCRRGCYRRQIGGGSGAHGPTAGNRRPTKAGLGSSAIRLPNGLIVGAIVVVNALGDIIDPSTGRVVAGMRNADGTFADARKVLRSGGPLDAGRPGENTTIASSPRTQASRRHR